jgi:ubiquilin
MEESKRAIAVKFYSSGTAFDYNFDPAQLTVRQLKEKLASHTTIPADSMRLVYSGRVLKDEDVVETYGTHNALFAASRCIPTSGVRFIRECVV